MNQPTSKVFATTIGAENWARQYDGEYPIELPVRQMRRQDGRAKLVVIGYVLPRRPTDADVMPVGRFSK
jgi:hypothetical protein